ncbi:hypothetical protein GQ57_09645 [Burkholderia sp. MSh2]|uniref:Uncharacterized protein n=1 Tax=Burkholderia paludis TaxID=1506587 RepID=A0A6J5E648_9BURK|nr:MULTISPECIES: hypothetical protein [Burkholderia]KEZ05991.1 hypothetical protein GQ57_09645 [Burkholderia sp. MSh2]KFG96771.1 hypothetical protein GQ56_0113330 [Burkholderia paludis]CAB3761940.1 hypothetical protein LMG30113_04072 [Burkholderia paludis]VWB38668.1 hypothetical protein BPA30113_01579 [Burkholderia paludis]
MSFATMLVRWLAGRLSGTAGLPGRPLPPAAHAAPIPPLRWRAPWLAWQLLSWSLLTLLAPPIWMIGTLLLINPSSDQPLFWGLAMTIVPVANGVAIVATNQRHHRLPFTRRPVVAAHMFGIAMTVGCALFVLLLWRSHAIASLVGPLANDGMRPATLAGWIAGLAALFGVTSSAHASIAHAWLAFEV